MKVRTIKIVVEMTNHLYDDLDNDRLKRLNALLERGRDAIEAAAQQHFGADETVSFRVID